MGYAPHIFYCSTLRWGIMLSTQRADTAAEGMGAEWETATFYV